MTLKSPKKLKFIPAKIADSQITRKLMHILTDQEKMENQFPEDGKVQIHESRKK